MKMTHLIANNIAKVFQGDNWTEVSVRDTLQDITKDEAVMQTSASRNTIAALTHHLYYWNHFIMQRMQGIEPPATEANGFDVPELKTEESWQELINLTRESFIALSEATKNFPEERLNEKTPNGKSTFYQNLNGIAEHAYYHLGQIVMLKHLVKRKV